jgi:hypothetical protein
VPGRGFANCVRAVRKLARPATTPVCQELAARGADRLSATMKRGTGLSQGREVLARAAVERREASASPKRGARREERKTSGNACWRARGIYPAPFGAPPPLYLLGRSFFLPCHKTRTRTKTRRENGIALLPPGGRASGRVGWDTQSPGRRPTWLEWAPIGGKSRFCRPGGKGP